MARTAEKLLEIARGEIGYHEKATNANLDMKTAPNDGSGNYTKYARDLNNAGYYNGNKNGYDWCDVFVDWCFWMLCGKDKAAAEKMECQTGELGAGCTWSAQYYQQAGRYYTRNPQPGDQIFFGDFDHTGIVESVTEDTITTIEGNTSSQVARRTYSRCDSWITGFGRPRFEESGEEPVMPEQPDTNDEGWCEVDVQTIGAGDTGYAVESAQVLLERRGYSCGGTGVDGDFGTDTEAAVKQFQLDQNLSADGIIGSDTWTALCRSDYTKKESTTDSGKEWCDVKIEMISKGSKGNAVRSAQALLEEYGYSCGSAGIDGDFGTGTEEAVKKFQQKNGLNVDGIVGPDTWERLIN